MVYLNHQQRLVHHVAVVVFIVCERARKSKVDDVEHLCVQQSLDLEERHLDQKDDDQCEDQSADKERFHVPHRALVVLEVGLLHDHAVLPVERFALQELHFVLGDKAMERKRGRKDHHSQHDSQHRGNPVSKVKPGAVCAFLLCLDKPHIVELHE